MPRCEAPGCLNESKPKSRTGPVPRYCSYQCSARAWRAVNVRKVREHRLRHASKPEAREYFKRYNAKRSAKDPTYFSRLFWARKQRWVDVLGGSCPCGESRLPCLDFDHIDPSTKTAMIAIMIRYPTKYPESVVTLEVAKCQLLCSNCHRLKTSSNWERASRLMITDDEK